MTTETTGKITLTDVQILLLRECLWGWGESEGQLNTEAVKEIDSVLKQMMYQNKEEEI